VTSPFDHYLISVGLSAEATSSEEVLTGDSVLRSTLSSTQINGREEVISGSDRPVEDMKERLEYIVRSSNLLSITSPTLSEVTAADNASPPSPEVIVVKRNSLVFPDDWEVTGQDWSDRTLVQISFNIIALSLNWFKLPTSTLPLQNSTPSLTPPPPTSPLLPTGHEVDTLGAFVRFVSANSALDLQLLLILDEIRLLDSVDM
jgi:hypothetical protein